MSERTYEVPDYAIQNMRNRIAALRAENAELVAVLEVSEQAIAELSHAFEVGPRWYTRGEQGMTNQVAVGQKSQGCS